MTGDAFRNLVFDGPDEMGREIAGGPEAVGATLAEVERLEPELTPVLHGASAVTLMGTGMSLAVAAAAAPAWRRTPGAAGRNRGITVRESTAAALGSDDGRLWRPGELVVAISKSGTSPETVAAARRAVAAGATLMTVTAVPDSPLAGLASAVVPTPIGEENGAGTMSGLAALSALLGMAGAVACAAEPRAELAGSLHRVAADWSPMAAPAEQLAAAERTWILGFGSGIGLADAAAIMWHEKVHRVAVSRSVSEFRHGPIEAARPGDAVIVVDPDIAVPARTGYLELLGRELEAIGIRPIWLSHDSPASARRIPLHLRPGPDASLEALLRLQQLARGTAHAAGTYRDGFAILRHVVTAAKGL
jgi:fructoselysine-6-P-deglycase FrlB-like protein